MMQPKTQFYTTNIGAVLGALILLFGARLSAEQKAAAGTIIAAVIAMVNMWLVGHHAKRSNELTKTRSGNRVGYGNPPYYDDSGFVMLSLLQSLGMVGLFTALAFAFAGCASFKDNQPVEQLVVRFAVAKIIEAGQTPEEQALRVKRIKTIAGDAKSFFDTGKTTLAGLTDLVNARIQPLNLSQSDLVLVDALIATVTDELQGKVNQGVIPADQVYAVSTVLGWIVDAAVVPINNSAVPATDPLPQ